MNYIFMKNKISSIINIFTAVLCVLAVSACAGPGHSVVVAGSTSVQPFMEVLAEEFAHIRPDCVVDVQGGGSSAGIAAVESGAAEIGMSSRDLTDGELHLWHIKIARDGLAVIVHPDNPVDALSLEQVRGIYTGEITDWGVLGGHSAKIHVIAREEGSGTRGAFEGLVMGGEYITPKAIVQDSNGAVRQLVLSDKNAVGFISLGLVDGSVKALTLDGAVPSQENVASGVYGLYRPFILVCASEPEGPAKEFLDYLFTPEARAVMSAEGLIPAE